jgi:hypothetical protein
VQALITDGRQLAAFLRAGNPIPSESFPPAQSIIPWLTDY